MFKRLKAYRVKKKLDVWDEKVKKRRENNSQTSYHQWYDFLNKPEQREYSRLAREHFDLTGSFEYFNPKTDAVRNDPTSPKAYLTVDHDRSTTHSYEYGDDGLIYQYANGERVNEIGWEPETFFGSRLEHPELWEISTREVFERLNR